MKSVNETQNERVVYIPVTYESLRNIANLQTVSISKDILKSLPEERITFIQLSQDNSVSIANNNDNGYTQEQVPTDQIEDTNISHNIDLPANGIVKTQAGQFQCTTCNQKFTKYAPYKKHIDFHSNVKKYKCKHCFESYNVEDNFKLHMAMHTSGSPICPLCNKKFQRFAGFKSHLLLHQVEETFTCRECFAEFEEETDYYKHMEKHTITDEAKEEKLPYTCSFCNYVFDDLTKYKDHINHHIKMKKLVFNSKRTRKKTTSDGKDKPHKCPTCGKSFRKTCLLERHLRIHSGERPFACTKCDKRFTQKGSLQIHLMKHTGHKPYKCTLCPASFFQKCNLRVHVEKAHTAPRDISKVYKCKQCTCVFRKIASLNAHITKVHTGVRQPPDEYQDVAEQLKELHQLTGHINARRNNDSDIRQTEVYVQLSETSVDGSVRHYVVKQKMVGALKIYLCPYCSKEFRKPSDLIRHVRVHTREKPYVEIAEDVDKQMTYSITFPEGTDLQNVEIGPATAEGNHSYSTILISCNDLQQIGAEIFDPGLTQEKIEVSNPVLEEPHDVNLMFMDPLAQQVDFHEAQNFESFDQVMLEDEVVVPSEINLNSEDVCLEMQKPLTNHDGVPESILPDIAEIQNASEIKINLIESGEIEQNKLILKQVPKLILPIDNANSDLKESVYITISVDDLKANNLNYFTNMIDLNNAINEASPAVEDLNLVAAGSVLVTESTNEECITCAVCKLAYDTLEDLANHHCVDVLENQETIIQPTSSEEADELVDIEEIAIPLEVMKQQDTDEDQLEQPLAKESDIETEGLAVAESGKKKSSNICHFCCKEFKKLSDLQRHIRTHTGERPYKCEKCIKSFSLKSTLISHMRTHNPSDSKITCHICNYTYSCKASLKVHMMIHSGVKPYQCHLCPARFRTAAHRRIHIGKHDQSNKPKKKGTVKSDIKNVLTYTNNYFESMLADPRVDSEEVQLVDDTTEINVDASLKVINSNSIDPSETLTIGDSLQIDFLQQLQQLGQQLIFDMDDIQDKHVEQPLIIENLSEEPEINIETPPTMPSAKEKKFECDICGKMYSTKSILRKHQKNHKKFVCSKCRKQFDVEDELEKHMKIHMGYRPFSCLHCANSFSEEASLKTHMKRIHNLIS